MFLDDELGMDEPGPMQSFISAPGGNFHKRKASGDLAIGTAAKMGRRRELNKAGGAWEAPSLFNGAIVAQVRRTTTGMRHEAISQHELDAYMKWTEGYQVLDDRGEAKEFRELHKAWKRRCGICWFSRGVEARTSTEALHPPDNCPQKNSAIWESATQRADVIGSKVLTKRVMGGELVDWPVSSGCWKCGLPAWRCDSFEHIPGRFFRPKVPEFACQDENMLRHIAGSVLAHFQAGAACVVAHIKESWAQEKIELESQYGINWLQDNSNWTKPESSYFALVVFELEKFGTIARST
jgi:hypothetical protein